MRLNQVFNGMGRHSPVWAGNLGVLSILFTVSQRGIQYARSDEEDSLNTICGASLAGALYKYVFSLASNLYSCTCSSCLQMHFWLQAYANIRHRWRDHW
jgi:hypothetical protein